MKLVKLKKVLVALVLALALLPSLLAAGPVEPALMPSPFFDIVCAPAQPCALLSPTFSGTSTFTGPARFSDGTASAPSIAFASDSTTGMFKDAAGTWGFSSSATQKIRLGSNIQALNTGGIGWSPSGFASFTLSFAQSANVGSLRVTSGTTPTQSGTTCGTGPTLTGNNSNGSVTLGTTPGLPCTIVFNGTWTAAPHCYLNPEVLTTGTTTVRATGISTTQFVITSSAALVATDKVTWWCVSE